jgi:hypothetical protein
MRAPAGVDETSTTFGAARGSAIGQLECATCNQQDKSQAEAESEVIAIMSDSSVANGLAIVRIESVTWRPIQVRTALETGTR